MNGLLTIPEAADKLKVSRQRVDQLIAGGRLSASKVLGVLVVSESAVTALLKELKPLRAKYGRKNGRK